MHTDRKAPLLRLLAWLLPQLISLALSAAQVRFSYRWIDPPQRWAVEQLLVVQVCTAIFLLRLLNDAVFCVAAFASGTVMLALARMLAMGSTVLLSDVLCLGLWITAMFGFAGDRYCSWFRSALGLWTLGGVLLAYSATEFGGEKWRIALSPLLIILDLCQREKSTSAGWLMLLGLTTISLAHFSVRRKRDITS